MAHALAVDRFGNVALDVGPRATSRARGLTLGDARGGRGRRPSAALATYAQTFADVPPGELLVYEDA